MATSLDYSHNQFAALPHRRPVPPAAALQYTAPADQYSHSRTRTASSNVLPSAAAAASNYPHYSMTSSMQHPSSRRTLSTSTTASSSASSTHMSTAHSTVRDRPPPSASYPSSIRRSTSSRSDASQGASSSYVALLRKQKATVWCDRAQHDDPRLLAQQRAAKARAQAEVVGGVSATGSAGRTSSSSGGGITGGVRSKIRHHGAVKASAYSGGLGAQGNLSGAGVPMRLSASEVDDEQGSENGNDDPDRRYHQRNSSGRSSSGSAHRTHSGYFGAGGIVTPTPGATQQLQQQPQKPFSTASGTPPSAHSYSPVDRSGSIALSPHTSEETPMPGTYSGTDYFRQPGSGIRTGGSGSSGSSAEQRFGDVGSLQERPSHDQPVEPQHKQKSSDELKRRGSVDDRTMTMSGVRLFVANPDADSD